MNHTAFFKALKEKNIATCYLFEGAEEYIKETALKQLEKLLLPPGMEQLNCAELDNPGADEIIAAAETLPFMADRRLVIVRNLALLTQGKGKDEATETERLAQYLPTMAPSACLVFYVRGKADGRKKLYNTLKKEATLVAFDTLSDEELHRWIMQTIGNMGKTISPALAAELSFTVGSDGTLLRGEMEKLCAHAGDRQEINKEDIAAVASRSVECTVFDMVDALVAGNSHQAFLLLAQLLRTGGDRIGSLAMVLRQYRILFHLKTMREARVPNQEIRSRLGIKPFAVDRADRQARAYTTAQLEEAVALCLDTDFGIKSGKLPQEGAVEAAMLRLCQLRQGTNMG